MSELIGGRRFTGRNVVVTGAGSGIGASAARLFASEGARVACVDMNGESAAATAAALNGSGVALTADVCREVDVTRMASAVLDAFGSVDVLVNVAGGATRGAVDDIALTDWERCLAANVTSVYLCSKAFIPSLRSAHSPSIVNTCSVFATVASPGFAAYHAGKGAVRALTVSMARDLGPVIRVNCVSPGIVESPSVRASLDASDDGARIEAELVASARILKRMAHPDEIGQAMLFLASEHASYITGHDLVVDGGTTVVAR